METKYKTKHEHYQLGRLPHHPGIREFFQLNYSAQGTVLELGAGTGIGTIELSNYFSSVIAVEPVSEMMDACKRAIDNENVTFINSAVEGLEVGSLGYRYLICFQATHWFYETPTYQTLYSKAEKPVVDICSFVSFPEDQQFFDELAKENTIVQSHRGTTYPFDVAQTYSYQRQISVDHAAHQLCSRSWVEHESFPQIRTKIAERYRAEEIFVDVETRIHAI